MVGDIGGVCEHIIILDRVNRKESAEGWIMFP